MKWQGRRQSTNVEVQTPKQRAEAAQAGKVQPYLSSRVINPEPIESNQDPPLDEYLETMQGLRNPAKTLKAKDRPIDTNPSDHKFFKHTVKGK